MAKKRPCQGDEKSGHPGFRPHLYIVPTRNKWVEHGVTNLSEMFSSANKPCGIYRRGMP